MWLLLSAVISASLMGSLHCVGMCGPLALWAAGADRSSAGRAMITPSLLYHLGRLLTYGLAGAAAGFFGQLLDWSGQAMGLQLVAARLAGGLMISCGLVALYRLALPRMRHWWQARRSASGSRAGLEGAIPAGPSLPALRPSGLTGVLVRLRPRIFRLPLAWRGLATGMLTALLPCGWLYLFALLAASTGSASWGAVVMAAFWLGSVPALVGLVAGAKLFGLAARRSVPVLVAVMLVATGMLTMSGRGFARLAEGWSVAPSASLRDQLQLGAAGQAVEPEAIRAGIEQLVTTPLPCCQAVEASTPPPAATTGESP